MTEPMSGTTYNDPYKSAMDGISRKMALQSIRKVIKDNQTGERQKLNLIVQIVHSYENDIKKGE